MGEFPDEDSLFRAFNDRRQEIESRATSVGSVLLVFIVGVYTFFKALELLGYPARRILHMATEKLGEILPGTAAADDAQNTETQNGGNMLSRTFGLNGTSLLQKGVRGVAGALSKVSSDVPPGLGNWDNSCYQNSVIQGLASLPSLRTYLSETTAEYPNLGVETTNGALADMLTKLNDPKNHGQNFWIRGKLKSMSTFQQQDAQEYYSKILDALDNEVKKEATKRRPSESWKDATKVVAEGLEKGPEDAISSSTEDQDSESTSPKPKVKPNPLDGLLAQRVGCIKCGYVEGLSLIPFNCVTVSLGRNNAYDIGECLDEYTSLEHIEGVECAKCTLLKNKATLAPLAERAPAFAERLQAVEEALENDNFDDKTLVKKFNILKKNWTQSTKSRQAVIARPPKSLVLHVNRSIFDEMTGAMYKNTASVAYPKVLDLGNWCLGSDAEGEAWPRDPTKSMLLSHAQSSEESPYQYRLRAAVTHYGSHGNGHYVCYRPHAYKPATDTENKEEKKGEQWWRFSDDSVYAITESQAHQSNIFMLFYERIDESTPLIDEPEVAIPETTASEENVPLPSVETESELPATDGTADTVPLPAEDEDASDERSTEPIAVSEPSAVPTPMDPSKSAASAYPTPPPDSPPAIAHADPDASETGSEDAPSTILNSDSEADSRPSTPHIKAAPGPHTMRTAGAPTHDGESRKSLAMVTAT